MTERLVCTLQELREKRVVGFDLGRNAVGRPQRGLVVINEAGDIFAYQDLCRHLPVYLDVSRRYLSDDKHHLVCMTHGALYRIHDGLCIAGPCDGLALYPLPLRQHDDQLWVTWPLPSES